MLKRNSIIAQNFMSITQSNICGRTDDLKIEPHSLLFFFFYNFYRCVPFTSSFNFYRLLAFQFFIEELELVLFFCIFFFFSSFFDRDLNPQLLDHESPALTIYPRARLYLTCRIAINFALVPTSLFRVVLSYNYKSHLIREF